MGVDARGELSKKSAFRPACGPEKLVAIPRNSKHLQLGLYGAPVFGYDLWNHYEVSWLDDQGKPQAATAQIVYACDSESIIEATSLKLYFDALNHTRFESIDRLNQTVTADLSSIVAVPVSFLVCPLQNATHRIISPIEGICIDEVPIDVDSAALNATRLAVGDEFVEETLYSNLLRSNCPLTAQADWGTVWIRYKGRRILREGLLEYIVSFRQHSGFQEDCVERIFVDVLRCCGPSVLTVGARYNRRGGIDINPVRSTCTVPVTNPRLIRQ